MSNLLDGIRQYESEQRQAYADRFAELAGGQSPHTLFLGCSDSRVVPSVLAGAGPGELFVVRNVGNLAPALRGDALSGTPSAVVAAVTYALDVLGVQDLVVCGHSNCGAMRAVLDGGVADPYVRRWLEAAQSALHAWRLSAPMDPSLPEVDQLSQCSARLQLEHLRQYPAVRRHLDAGTVRLHAFWFDIADGRMLAYDESARAYRPAIEVLDQTGPEVVAA
jgi:carbonic anhydrase